VFDVGEDCEVIFGVFEYEKYDHTSFTILSIKTRSSIICIRGIVL
jgi:hypothetical protein